MNTHIQLLPHIIKKNPNQQFSFLSDALLLLLTSYVRRLKSKETMMSTKKEIFLTQKRQQL
jgi:hypothetical protein